MAFQPIVDLRNRSVFAYEALVRGPQGEPAGETLAKVTDDNRYAFDQSCRVKAIELAAALNLAQTGAALSINFLPNAVYRPETCIRATLAAADRTRFPIEKLIFEVTEGEQVKDRAHLSGVIAEYQRRGLRAAIDDFGAGYAGLNLLAEFQPDLIKIDMEITRGIDGQRARQAIVAAIVSVCRHLDIVTVAEGIETEAEMATLLELGVPLQQGFLFAKPGFECLPAAHIP